MEFEEISKHIMKTHKITNGGDFYKIKLNKPKDFIYDIDDIILYWYFKDNSYSIDALKVPDEIIANMLAFQITDVVEYLKLLENNLTTFCMGRNPEIPIKNSNSSYNQSLRPGELPKDYKFPFNNQITPNLRFEADNKNVSFVSCNQVNTTVSCSKCNCIITTSDMKKCKKCSSSIGINYIPIFNPSYLGFLNRKRCTIIAFNPTKYQFSCNSCNTNYETPEIGIRQVYVLKCYECHSSMRINIHKINHIEKADYKLKPGTELPLKGACKHYKKSFRWFRFSCCSSLYPCDICHNEAIDHKAEVANKMVCGQCSKEQSVKPDCSCGMNLKTSHTQFWEGGKGNRDKSTMNKKDSKKYNRK